MIRILICLILFSPYVEAKLENFFDGKTNLKEPFKIRDPFETPKFKSQNNRLIKERIGGVLDNVPKYEQKYDLKQIKIVGVLLGPDRRIIIQYGSATQTFVLKEGDRMGVDGPEIKAILAGGVILVEKITNIYGEDEFIETIVPISE